MTTSLSQPMSVRLLRPARLRAGALLLCLTAALGFVGGGSAAVASASTHASLPEIEREVMCVTCKIPLNVAQSPQADRERAFIQGLIDHGSDATTIKHELVSQYGSAVLALPSDSGFDATAYIVPIVALLV